MSENKGKRNLPVGTVFLVGAGPGDRGLFTLRGKQLLETAAVVVYDQLVGDSILNLCHTAAEKIYVGKKAGKHSLPQDEINQLLVDKAREGKSVVRLKGGDPFVFGRGGEEALFLVENDVPFEVVPGVTAAVAATAYAGIPVTHRGITSTLGLVTGHEDPTKDESDIDWDKLAGSMGTLVFYMGVKNLPEISSRLIKGGRDPQTPVALVREGTLSTQRTLTGTLSDIADLAKNQGFKPPSIIVVGEVVKLREKLHWIEKKPLFGKRIVVTRTRQQASELSGRLEALGAEVVEFATIRIEPPEDLTPLRQSVRNLEHYDWIIFTSANGVESFFRELHLQGFDSRRFGTLKVCAIGPATSFKLAERGIAADLMPEKFVAEAVLDAFSETEDLQGKRILLPRADIARDALPAGLEKLGAKVDQVEAYRTVIDDRLAGKVPEKLEKGEVDMVTFTSSSTVTNFCKLMGPSRLKQIKGLMYLASIGPITTETIRANGLSEDVAAEVHTIPGLVEVIVEFFRNNP